MNIAELPLQEEGTAVAEALKDVEVFDFMLADVSTLDAVIDVCVCTVN